MGVRWGRSNMILYITKDVVIRTNDEINVNLNLHARHQNIAK